MKYQISNFRKNQDTTPARKEGKEAVGSLRLNLKNTPFLSICLGVQNMLCAPTSVRIKNVWYRSPSPASAMSSGSSGGPLVQTIIPLDSQKHQRTVGSVRS